MKGKGYTRPIGFISHFKMAADESHVLNLTAFIVWIKTQAYFLLLEIRLSISSGPKNSHSDLYIVS